jgi:exodeoxyribonuclease I
MSTYLFYDIETTGLNKAFDQVLQFSAIRTDATFKEIDRQNITVRLRPDIIPSPGALITHRIRLSEALKGLTEYKATYQIHRLLNTPGTVSLGYNTMGFDDEFLRFSFHRNLLPPYTHQYSNG